MVCLAQLLSRCVVADETSMSEVLGGQDAPTTEEVDEVVELKDIVCVGPFQTEILKGRAARVPAYHMHIMIMPIRHTEVESGKAHPLPPGLQVLYTYTTLTAGSKHVSIVVQNMTDSAIFLKKGVCLVHVVLATLVLPAEVPSEEPIKGVEAPQE